MQQDLFGGGAQSPAPDKPKPRRVKANADNKWSNLRCVKCNTLENVRYTTGIVAEGDWHSWHCLECWRQHIGWYQKYERDSNSDGWVRKR